MNDHARWGDEIAGYVLGALDADSAREVETHLSECEQCRAELRQLRAVVDLLPLAAQEPARPLTVPPNVRKRVMQNARPKRSVAWSVYAVAAACVIAAVTLGLLYASTQRTTSGLSRDDRQKTMAINALLSPDALHYKVAHGQVVVKGANVYLVMQNLQTQSPRHVYQAWTQKSGSHAMSPSLTFDSQGSLTLIKLPNDARSLVAVAVSIEPPGGSRKPTTKPIFVVKIVRGSALNAAQASRLAADVTTIAVAARAVCRIDVRPRSRRPAPSSNCDRFGALTRNSRAGRAAAHNRRGHCDEAEKYGTA